MKNYIKNVYFMLSYSFKILKPEKYWVIGSKDYDFIGDLFSELLVETILNMSKDDLEKDDKLNQIIKTTLHYLIKSKDLSKQSIDKLKESILVFENTELIHLEEIDFKNIKTNRDNKIEEILFNICYLIIVGLFTNISESDIKINKYLNEEQMTNIFESFIQRYYIRHFPELRTLDRRVEWFDNNKNETSLLMLSNNKNNIVLRGKNKSTVIFTNCINTNEKQYRDSYYTDAIYKRVSQVDLQTKKEVGATILCANKDKTDIKQEMITKEKLKMQYNFIDLNVDFRDIRKLLDNVAKSLN